MCEYYGNPASGPAQDATLNDREPAVEKMEAEGYCPSLVNDDHGRWAMSFEGESPIMGKCPYVTVILDEVDWADTAPLAICLAALAAVGASVETPEPAEPS